MSAADRALALRGVGLRPRLTGRSLHALALASEAMTNRLHASALERAAPGSVVTFAGVQGGAGVSTVTLLACGAVTRASDRPAVAIDLAAGTRGGLGGLAGAWSQTSAQMTAELVVAGGRLARPYAETQDGVRVMSDAPQAAIALEQTARSLLAAVAEAVERHAADHEIAAIARAGVEEGAVGELSAAYPEACSQARSRGVRRPQPCRD